MEGGFWRSKSPKYKPFQGVARGPKSMMSLLQKMMIFIDEK
jgi:hypothetical protein